MHIFGLPTPSPPPSDLDLDPHQDFELDPDPHQNNADPQLWAQLSKDCCLIYNYVYVYTKEQQKKNALICVC
jgi:hypothetical protein